MAMVFRAEVRFSRAMCLSRKRCRLCWPACRRCLRRLWCWDAGLATEDNIGWLKDNGYHYLVVSRKRKRLFDENEATLVKDQPNQKVRVQRIFNEETDEVELYCHSQAREEKERTIQNQFAERFETALQSLADGLSKKGATKQYDKVLERIGRLKEKYALAAQYYDITLTKDDAS
jgi:hypothetical protein